MEELNSDFKVCIPIIAPEVTVSVVGNLEQGTLKYFYNNKPEAQNDLISRIKESNSIEKDGTLKSVFYIEHFNIQNLKELHDASINHSAQIFEDLKHIFE